MPTPQQLEQNTTRINGLEQIASNEEKTNILMHIDVVGYNPLMLAVKFQPELLPSLFKIIAKLSLEQQAQILLYTPSDRWNVFMLAAAYNPKSLPPLLEALQRLSLEQQNSMLMQTTAKGSNAIMLAVSHDAEGVEPLLKALQELKPEQQTHILRQTDYCWDNANVLMLAMPNLDLFKKILSTVKNLPIDAIETLFTQRNNQECNLWKMGFAKYPKCLPLMLDFISQLDASSQTKIFNTLVIDENGYKQLLSAINSQPELSDSLSKIIENLTPDQQTKILMQVTDFQSNAISYAAMRSPQVLNPLLKTLKRLTLEQQTKIRMQTYNFGWNAVMKSAYYQPQNLTPLLENASEVLQFEMLTQRVKGTTDAVLGGSGNALHIALIKGSIEGVENILSIVNAWEERTNKEHFLLQVNDNKTNVLMMAMSNPKLFEKMLMTIKDLKPNSIENLFTQQDNQGRNIWALSLAEHPEYLPQMLAFLSELEPSLKAQMFKSLKNNVGKIYEKIITDAINSISEIQLDQIRKQLLQIPTDTLVELHNDKVLFKLAPTVKDMGRKRIFLELQMLTHMAVLKAKMEPLRDVEKDHQYFNTPYNTALNLYLEIEACWTAYSQETNDLEQLKAKLSKAINKARPELSTLDNGIGLISLLMRFVRFIVNLLPFGKLESDSEKVFTSLEEHAKQYEPRRAKSTAPKSVFFQPGPVPSAPTLSNLENTERMMNQSLTTLEA